MTSELDLITHDHVYVIVGFQKTAASIKSKAVQEILQRYIPPKKIIVYTDKNGKPHLLPVDGQTIYVSIAHAEDILLLALSTDSDIGVDVEEVRNRRYASQIAARYFDKEPNDIEDFYRAWTAREAFIKTIGSRISESMARICTKKYGPDLLLGLSPEYSHRVSFFEPQKNFMAAFCRSIDSRRDYQIIR